MEARKRGGQRNIWAKSMEGTNAINTHLNTKSHSPAGKLCKQTHNRHGTTHAYSFFFSRHVHKHTNSHTQVRTQPSAVHNSVFLPNTCVIVQLWRMLGKDRGTEHCTANTLWFHPDHSVSVSECVRVCKWMSKSGSAFGEKKSGWVLAEVCFCVCACVFVCNLYPLPAFWNVLLSSSSSSWVPSFSCQKQSTFDAFNFVFAQFFFFLMIKLWFFIVICLFVYRKDNFCGWNKKTPQTSKFGVKGELRYF